MNCDSDEYTYLVVDGIDNCIAALDDIKEGRLKKCFIEMSICAGSCVGGPAMERERRRPVTDTIAVNRYAGKKDFVVEQPAKTDLIKDHRFIGLHRQMPGKGRSRRSSRKPESSPPSRSSTAAPVVTTLAVKRPLLCTRGRPISICACPPDPES